MLLKKLPKESTIELKNSSLFEKISLNLLNHMLPYVIYEEDIDNYYGYYFENDFQLPFSFSKKEILPTIKIHIYFQLRFDRNEDNSYSVINLIDVSSIRVLYEQHLNYVSKLKKILSDSFVLNYEFFLKYVYFYDNYQNLTNGKHSCVDLWVFNC